MRRIVFFPLVVLLTLIFAVPAFGHFMVFYTPEIAMEKVSKNIDMRMVFTHPAEAGYTMDMGGVKDFYVIYKRGDNVKKKIDLKETLTEITWTNPDSIGKAYSAVIDKKNIRSMGDYVFVFTPGYYYEDEEDLYMQQITKLILNVGGRPGAWAEPVGLPCEIVPLIKPYGLWTGNVFKARVLSDGKPVPHAEVEVEFLNHMPDMDKNAMPKEGLIAYPNNTLVSQTIYTDDQGYITFGIPKAGWWGFSALGVGPEKEYQGKELSQDAVIWVKAVDMK